MPKETVLAGIAAIAARQLGVISRAQALAAGLTRHEITRLLRTGWVCVLPGVYRLPGCPDTCQQRLVAALLWAGDGAVVSHRAAARVWRLDGIEDEVVEIAVPDRRRAPQPWLRVRELQIDERDVKEMRGVRVTAVHRTLIDLAAVASGEQLESALECALRRGLTSIPYLRKTMDRICCSGRRGCAALRALLDERDPQQRPSESQLETQMHRLARRFHLPRLVVGHPIVHDREIVARADFAYPELRIDIEVDGSQWHRSTQAWRSDRARDTRLRALGWVVLRFTAEEIRRRPQWVAEQIREAIAQRLTKAASR